MSLPFIFRHLRGHWRDNLVLWLGLLVLCALAAILPIYSMSIAGRSLDRQLNTAPTAARNLLISGSGLNEDLYVGVAETLGPLLARRVEVRDLEIRGNPVIHTPDGPRPFEEFLAIQLYAFDNLEEDATVVEGRLPEPGGDSVIEVAAGVEVMTSTNFITAEGGRITPVNLRVGDELRAPDGSRFRVVGVVAPSEPNSDAWWGTSLPFRSFRRAGDPDTIVTSLLVPPEDMVARYPGAAHQWRLLTDLRAVNVDNAAAVQSTLRDVETRLSTNFLQVDTGLIDLIDVFFADLSRGRVALFLLAFQAFLLALLAFVLVASALIQGRRDEFTALAERGAGAQEIVAIHVAGFLLLALAAFALAPLLAGITLRLLSAAGNRPAATMPPAESWLLSGAAALAGTLAFLLIVLPVARAAPRRKRPMALPHTRPFWQRAYLDAILLLLGGLLYWQAASGGRIAGAADPLLLLGPTLALLGAALLIVRLYPFILRVVAGVLRGSSFHGAYGLAHMGRASADGGHLALIVTLAVGLALFALLMGRSLAVRQAEIAHYVAGADVRAGVPIEAGAATEATQAGLDGIAAVTPAYRNDQARWVSETRRGATLLAVDPATFGDVGRFPPGSSLTMADVLPALELPSGDALPAVFSHDAYPQDKEVGDVVTYLVGTERVDFEVRGLIGAFPSLSGPFLLTNLALLEEAIDFARLGEVQRGQREVWIEAEPGRAAAVGEAVARGEGPPGGIILASSAGALDALTADMAGRQSVAALRLNVRAVALISAAAVAVLLILAARRRDSEFDLLRTLGLSRGQWLSLLILEGATAVAVGLVAGTAAGYGLARMMLPVLSRVLSAAVGGDAIYRLAVDWPSLLGLYALLIAGYALALLVLPVALRAGVPRVSGLGVEAE